MSIKTHTFRGFRYRIILHHLDGYVEVPGWETKQLYVDPDCPPKSFLETAIHEAMHAEDKDTLEQVIDRRAKSMARWLWRLGYRREG